MGLFDDLYNRATTTASDLTSTVYGYFESRVTDAVVKVGEAPAGNQTAEQIAAGQYGAPSARVPSAANSSLMKMAPLALAGVAAFLLFSKRSRK